MQHIDDFAVDRFAEAMKTKLAKTRAQGRGGWNDPAQCSIEYLQELLIEQWERPHTDYVDIANFAMMLYHRTIDETPEVIPVEAVFPVDGKPTPAHNDFDEMMEPKK